MAVGTAALVLILSVYNGFDELVRENLDKQSPDLVVRPVSGKTFSIDDPAFARMSALPGVLEASGVLEETVALKYGQTQGVATLRGLQGAFGCSVSRALAAELGIRTSFLERLEMFYPDPRAKFSMADPSSSLSSISMRPTGIVDSDEKFVIVPLASARELLHIDSEVSAFEIWGDVDPGKVHELASDRFLVLDKFRQHPAIYKMMRSEKAAIFLILIFVVIIIAFNIFGSLSMLIIEKDADMATLRSIGADNATVRRIFFLEGWMVSLLGLAIGLVVGVALTLAQQYFGLVHMPGNYLVNTYPVALKASDIVLSALGVASIGGIISAISIKNIR